MRADVYCDGCGKKAPLIYINNGVWKKPEGWKTRKFQTVAQIVCSEACAKKL